MASLKAGGLGFTASHSSHNPIHMIILEREREMVAVQMVFQIILLLCSLYAVSVDSGQTSGIYSN
jgi:hypothetical protein